MLVADGSGDLKGGQDVKVYKNWQDTKDRHNETSPYPLLGATSTHSTS